MPMIVRIHCVTDREPDAYHPDDGKIRFAVNLSLECALVGQLADAHGEDARDRFKGFLNTAHQIQLWQYAIGGDDTNGFSATPIRGPVAQVMAAQLDPAPDSHPIFQWLTARDAGPEFWVTHEAAPGVVQSVDASRAGAGHLLRGAHGWNAPAAHVFGLTRLVTLAPPQADEVMVLLPAPAQPGDVLPAVDLRDGRWDVTYNLPELGTVCCRTSTLKTGPTACPTFMTDTGYLKVNSEAEQARRMLDWFERDWAGLLGSTPFVLDGKNIRELCNDPDWEIFDDNRPKIRLKAPKAAWRIVTGLVTALDPIVAGLLRFAANENGTRAAGDILLPLVTTLVEGLQTLGHPQRKTAVREALRDLLLDSPIFVGESNRKDWVDGLRTVLDLKPAPSGSTDVEKVLLDRLLEAYQHGEVEIDEAEAERYCSRRSTKDRKSAVEAGGKEHGVLEDGFGYRLIGDPYRIVLATTQALHEEAGAEAAILRLFESAARKNDKQGVAQAITAKLFPSGPPPEGIQEAIESAWRDFVLRLNGAFNGEEAARRSAGADFLEALLKVDGGTAPPTAASLRQAVTDADWFAKRCLGPDTHYPFGVIGNALCRPALPGFTVSEMNSLRGDLGGAYSMALKVMPDSDQNIRFLPDPAPQPLPIQVVWHPAAEAFEEFFNDFNGICIALRRMDSDHAPWSYANLASLSLGGVECPGVGLRQWLPALQDGRAAMFIDYEGLPFASTAFDGPRLGKKEGGTPFVKTDVADLTANETREFKPLPRLLYGRRYEAFSFATTNSGSLPKALQAADGRPWAPKPDIAAPGDASLVFETTYRRRTAVGAVRISEQAGENAPRRVGAAIPGVRPLAADYPRRATLASANAEGAFDLMRTPGGEGMLEFDSVLTLADFAWVGSSGSLTVQVYDKPVGVGDAPLASVELQQVTTDTFQEKPVLSLVLQERILTVTCGDQEPKKSTDPIGDGVAGPFWIRLRASVTDGAAAVSFAEDRTPGEHAGTAAPLLLLRPDQGDWSDAAPQNASLTISTPRVGYVDFDRWLANPDLMPDCDLLPASRHWLLDALHLAYAMRDQPVCRDRDKVSIATYLERLPDPAVDSLLVELVPVDALDGMPSTPPRAVVLDLCAKLRDWAAWVKTDLAAGSPTDIPFKLFHIATSPTAPGPNRRAFDTHFSFDLQVLSGNSLKLEKKITSSGLERIEATIPEGVVAELRVSPRVRSRILQDNNDANWIAPFHHGMMQMASRRTPEPNPKLVVFPGDSIVLETMSDHWMDRGRAIELVGKQLAILPRPPARKYDLVAKRNVGPQDRADWRRLGEIGLTRQRWQPNGLPIYGMIDPREFPTNGQTPSVGCVRQIGIPADPQQAARLNQFEREIFRDRDAGETVWQILEPLVPQGAESATDAPQVLQSIDWEAPSATYFRHRFDFRSRYAGAFKNKDSVAHAWNKEPEAKDLLDAWNWRVAVLADLSRIALTRPQLRALLPLTAAPSDSSTPPCLAYLQEPPYGEGGLADRMAAEIILGFGYGFENAQSSVGILDARKEFGKDPRLTYERIPDDDSLSVELGVQGPIGLGFEGPGLRGGAFPNSAVTLLPRIPRPNEPSLEEHFLRVAMRRYLHPGWLADSHIPEQEALPLAGCFWLEFAGGPTEPGSVSPGVPVLSYSAGPNPEQCKVVLVISNRDLKASKNLVGGSDSNEFVKIGSWPADEGRLGLLHSPAGQDRYAAALFRLPADGSDPVLIASFEWSATGLNGASGQTPVLVPAAGAKRFRCQASAPTFAAWARTARNFDRVTVQNADGKLNAPPVDKLKISRKGNEIIFPAQIPCSPLLGTDHPLHVHRHLALIGSRDVEGLGRPMEEYSGALFLGQMAGRIDAESAKALANGTKLRIVEIETPAAILAAARYNAADGTFADRSDIPATYRHAYLDLKATNWTPDRHICLHIRFSGSKAHLEKFGHKKLWLECRSPGKGADTPLRPVDLPPAPFGLEIRFKKRDAGEDHRVFVATITMDGVRSSLTEVGGLSIAGDTQGIFLRLAVAPDLPEFWADVSMLHFTGAMDSSHVFLPFDFDCLFSLSSENEKPDPAEAVTTERLASLSEAQARIVAVSPRIAFS